MKLTKFQEMGILKLIRKKLREHLEIKSVCHRCGYKTKKQKKGE